jgi:hypothetical protein
LNIPFEGERLGNRNEGKPARSWYRLLIPSEVAPQNEMMSPTVTE